MFYGGINMAYCRKCGTQLKDEDVFCYMCGQSIDRGESLPKGDSFDEDGTPILAVPSMTKEESINLAEKLKTEYGAIEKLQRDISDNETVLKRPVNPSGRRHSAFKFFWPFLIFAYLALNVIYIGGVLISASNSDEGGMIASLFLGLAAAAGLLIFGGVRAGRKRDRLNQEIADVEYQMRKRQNDLVNRNNELKTKLTIKKREVSQYTSMIPSKFRTKQYMDRVLMLLQTGRAESFADAINMLKGAK